MPSKNIVDFANQVKSYALGIKDQQVLGAWNLLKNDGLATSTTEGATFTKNADLSVTINRETATTNASYYNVTSGTNGEVTETRESGTYYLSGVPNGSTGLTLQYYDVTANQSWNDSGSGAEITVVKGHTIKVSMRVAPNQTLSNVTVKPMIALESNQPYVPPAMTNRELTDAINIKDGTITDAQDANVTANIANMWLIRTGKVAQLHLDLTVSTADTSGTWHKVCSLNFKPQKENMECVLPWDSELSTARSIPIKIDVNGDVYVRPKIITTIIADIEFLSV